MHKIRREFRHVTTKINTKTIIGEMRDKKKLKAVWCRENYLANWQKSLFTSTYFNCKYLSHRHTKVRATPKTIFSEKDLKTSWTALAQQVSEKSYQDELREAEIHSFQHPNPSSEGRVCWNFLWGQIRKQLPSYIPPMLLVHFHGVQLWHSSPSPLLASLALP